MSGQKRQSIVTSGNGVDYIVIRGRLRWWRGRWSSSSAKPAPPGFRRPLSAPAHR